MLLRAPACALFASCVLGSSCVNPPQAESTPDQSKVKDSGASVDGAEATARDRKRRPPSAAPLQQLLDWVPKNASGVIYDTQCLAMPAHRTEDELRALQERRNAADHTLITWVHHIGTHAYRLGPEWGRHVDGTRVYEGAMGGMSRDLRLTKVENDAAYFAGALDFGVGSPRYFKTLDGCRDHRSRSPVFPPIP